MYSFLDRYNIFLTIFSIKFVVKCAATILKIDSQINVLCANIIVIRMKMEGRSLFSKKKKVWIFYPNGLKPTFNVTKDLLKVKTFASSQHLFLNRKFVIMDYLPCPCKIPIQNPLLA